MAPYAFYIRACQFDPCWWSQRRTFDKVRADFEAAWRQYLPKRTKADFQAWRNHRDWTARAASDSRRNSRCCKSDGRKSLDSAATADVTSACRASPDSARRPHGRPRCGPPRGGAFLSVELSVPTFLNRQFWGPGIESACGFSNAKSGGLSRIYGLEDRGTNGKRGPELE